uniref:Uncharacterized protein n=1 Tax=Pectobacterium atrosepticum TaxID=29471 RepID=B8X8Z4_PECAT|nr:hypothetical protein [Pectobacterium atrosepticum]
MTATNNMLNGAEAKIAAQAEQQHAQYNI